ncbi:MAG: hypothetical protein EA356_09450 [Geminicoccaceae bacterium]|nr:MAG: hypothetical protein EA356_09450 [Geminicoccaceae bacterium]
MSAFYRAYTQPDFTPHERERVEIRFAGLHWRADRVIQAVFENQGYRAAPMPAATRDDLMAGRELADIGQCCPASFVTGCLANFLRREAARLGADEVKRRYVYVSIGSCGPCRFGQYHQGYELALRHLGMEGMRLLLLDQSRLEQAGGGGLEVNLQLSLGVVWAILCTDALQSLEYRTRPYETTPGATDRAAADGVALLCEAFRQRPRHGGKWSALAWHLTTRHFVRALQLVARRFDEVEVDRLVPKPVVKITGEFYLQTVEGPANYDIHRWLEAEGAEVYPAAIAVWLDYLLRVSIQNLQARVAVDRHARAKLAVAKVLQRLLRWTFERMRRALDGVPHALPEQAELRALAAPYYHHRLAGGEGDMLVGKALWTKRHRAAHMICELSPYSCLPNTMSVGAMAGVLGKHPDLLYAPLEVKGDAEVHALSRCQMILTEAKKRAQEEFDAALARTGLDLAEARRRQAARPALRRATTAIPHRDVVGTGANTVLHLAAGRA